MAVLNPLKLVIENYGEMKLPTSVSVPDFPADLGKDGTHEVAFDEVIYIEKDDYKEVRV